MKWLQELHLHFTLHKDIRNKCNSSSKIDPNTLVDTWYKGSPRRPASTWTSHLLYIISLGCIQWLIIIFINLAHFIKGKHDGKARVIFVFKNNTIHKRQDMQKMHIQIILASKGTIMSAVYLIIFCFELFWKKQGNEADTKAKLRQHCLDVVIWQLGELDIWHIYGLQLKFTNINVWTNK